MRVPGTAAKLASPMLRKDNFAQAELVIPSKKYPIRGEWGP